MTGTPLATMSAALSGPVGHFMRPTLTCAPEDSIDRAVSELRRNGGGILPIVNDGVLVGVIDEAVLTEVLAGGRDMHTACGSVVRHPVTIAPYSSAAESLRLLSELEVSTLVVADDSGRVTGIISPSDLFPRRRPLPRPAPIGGMATPFGVHLTSGALRSGPGLLAVMATGAQMSAMWIVAIIAATLALAPLKRLGLSADAVFGISQVASLPLFLLFMRLVPLSGIHAAEHMVVHAIERGEDLVPDVVARMPRVHPRCGTNLAAALFLFTGIFFTPWIPSDELRLLVASIVTLYCWRPLGSMAQLYVTTKKPTEAQIRKGIQSGVELIEKYAIARQSTAGIPRRIWNSGLLHVMCGGMLTVLVVKGISWLLHVPLPGID